MFFFFLIFQVTDPQLIKLLEFKLSIYQPYIGVFVRKNPDPLSYASEVRDLNDCHKIGTFVKINEITRTEGKLQFVGVSHRRIQLDKEVDDDGVVPSGDEKKRKEFAEVKSMLKSPNNIVLMVETDNVQEVLPDIHTAEYRAIAMEIVKTIRDIVMENSLIRENLHQILGQNLRVNDSPSYLADLAASITSAKPTELQAILEETNVMNRMKMSLELLKKEKQVLELQKKISEEVDEKISKQHKQFMLQEQLKAVKKELGLEKDDKEALTEKFKAMLVGKTVPEIVSQTFESELQKLGYLERHSAEFS